jgi:hypothetical protein
VIWTCVVGVATWNAWPPTLDPNRPPTKPISQVSPPPPDADVTYLMNGVIGTNEKLTKAELGARLKAKYPVYQDLSDNELAMRTLTKYPYYRQFVSDLTPLERDLPDLSESPLANPPEVVQARNPANRYSAVRFAVVLWLLPAVALYAFGYGVRWVYRGFKNSS